MFLALALTSILALAPQDPPAETCREAYTEAWFQETAEADLEAALRSYRRCAELGQAADRELVARALWRMGMIARAREENTVAEELFRRVTEEFEGTRAAERVREVLAAPAGVQGVESEPVAEAREILRAMLLDSTTATAARLRTVLRNLTVQQIAHECESQGESLSRVLSDIGSGVVPDHANDLAELALIADARTAWAVIGILELHDYDNLHEPILRLAHESSGKVDSRLLFYLARREEQKAMEALVAVVDRSPELLDWETQKGAYLGTLLANPHPIAGELLDRLIATVPATRPEMTELGLVLDRIGDHPTSVVLLQMTPAGERLRAFFPSLPTDSRDRLARQVLERDPPREVIDLLLADCEPAVRLNGLLALLHGDDPAWRVEVLERVEHEPIELQLKVLNAACRKSDPALPMQLLLEVPTSVARELVYYAALVQQGPAYTNQGRGIPEVLRTGLDRGDPELLRAAFAPSAELSRLWSVYPPLQGITTALQQDLPVAEGQSLAERLTLAALSTPEEAVQLGVPEFARGLLPPDALARCMEPALLSPSAPLRRAALDTRPQGISNETLVRLLLDPNHLIFSRTLGFLEPGPEALLDALDELSAERQLEVLRDAKRRDFPDVVRAIYFRATTTRARETAREAFGFLKTRDAGVLIEALSHQDLTIQGSAARQIALLQLPGWNLILWNDQALGNTRESHDQAQRKLRAGIAEVTAALQRWNVERLTQRMNGQPGDLAVEIELAAELASLDDRKRLIEYTLRGGGWTSVGGRGLVMLEDVDAMRFALRASYQPAQLLQWALELDLVDTLFELEHAGRLRSWDLISKLMQLKRYADLARLLLGDEGPVLDRTLDARTVSLIVDAAAGLDDPELLSRAAARLYSPSAVKALFEQGEITLILNDLPEWRGQALHAAMTEVARRTGAPAMIEWPEYVTEQQALIEKWREQLGTENR